jgi:hypothetical protein
MQKNQFEEDLHSHRAPMRICEQSCHNEVHRGTIVRKIQA